MPMFGDLNKLNTQQEKQQQVKQSARAVPDMPIDNTQEQTSTELPAYQKPEASVQRHDILEPHDN